METKVKMPNIRKSFIGYNRDAVDSEFEKLIGQVNDALDKMDDALDKNDELRREVQDLRDDRRELEISKRAAEDESAELSRKNAAMAESVSFITNKVTDLEKSLTSAKETNESLQNKIDAVSSEKGELQLRLDSVQEHNRELAMRERQFDEIEKSVSSIMSVTKRATDRLFQKSVENQENVIRIAGDAAQETALIRADMASARDDMNVAFDELQDRIDKIDATLTGAVHKLVAIKHDSGLKPKNINATIESEVERLLSLRAGEVDYSDGKGYTVPVLGPYSAKFISDAAKKVNSGETDGHPAYENRRDENETPLTSSSASGNDGDASKPRIDVKKTYQSPFESTQESVRESNKLLDEADERAARRQESAASSRTSPYQPQTAAPPANPPQYQPRPQLVNKPDAATSQPSRTNPPVANPAPMKQPTNPSEPIPLPSSAPNPAPQQPYVPPTPQQQPSRIGFDYGQHSFEDEGFEQVDISKLKNGNGDLVMGTPELQYIGSPTAPVGGYGSTANAVGSQAYAGGMDMSYAGAAPTFTPYNQEFSVVNAEADPDEQEADIDEGKPKRAMVRRSARKVKVAVRHNR